MKSYREELWFETKTRRAYVNITPEVEAAVRKSGVREGLVLVNAMHITASVYINDDEAGLLQDYDAFLERVAPHAATYRHNETGEDNGDAHIKRQLMGREVVVAITDGKLDFGPWEQIFYGEFDGRRFARAVAFGTPADRPGRRGCRRQRRRQRQCEPSPRSAIDRPSHIPFIGVASLTILAIPPIFAVATGRSRLRSLA